MKHSKKTNKHRIIAVILSVITIFATLPLQSVFSLSDNDKNAIDEYAVFDTISLLDLGLNETVVAPSSNGEIASKLQYDSPIDTENFSRVFKFNYTPTGKKFGLQIYNKNDGKNNSLKIETSSVSLIANTAGDSNKSISKSLTRNTTYNIEFGMKKVVSGDHAGKMYMYVNIDGELLLENYSSDIKGLEFTGIYGFNSTLSNVNTQKTVKFMANGSEYCAAQTVKRGQFIPTKPLTPVNYEEPSLEFLGWFEENSVTPWDFASDKVYSDLTLVARFEGDILKVSFDVNGGEPTVGDVSVLKGGKLTEPTSPTKEGFEFMGWFAEGSDKPFDFSKSVNSSIVLTAKWLEIEYSAYDVITLRDLGLGEEVIIPNAEGTVGEKLTYENPSDTETYSRVLKFKMIPPNAKYSTQIYFARNGWGNRLVIASGVCYVITKVPVEETLQALYKFEAGKEYDFEYGMIRILNGKNAGKMRLYLKINGEQLIETVSADTENLSYTGIYGQGLTIKSVDTPVKATYKVGDSVYSAATVNRGSLLTEPADPSSPDKTKPAFFGWNYNGEKWQFSSDKVYRNVTLTADFVKNAYKVIFDSDGGDFTPDTQRIESGKTATKPKTLPQKKGMDFAYWQNIATGKEFDFKTTITGNITLKAVYTLKKYKVTFRALGKQVGTATYTLEDTKVTEPKVPAVNGATGKWSSYKLDGGNKVSVAIYDGVSKSSDGKIKLTTYGDFTVDVRNTITRVLLDITDFLGLKRIISAEFDKSTRVFYDSQSIEFKWSDNSASKKYSVLFADNKDFKNSYVVETTKKVLTDTVGIFTPGKTYYWKVCGSSGSVSAVDSFVISDEPCRWISSGAVTNMRDGGGWETIDGKRVKYGMVYRSGSYDEPADDWSYLDETAQYVFDYLGIKSEIELRADVNHGAPVFKEDGNYLHINGGAYEAAFDKGVQREYKKIFEFLADENNYPLIYHCSGGADRTGTLAYILNGFLGVDLEDLYRDYELTSLARPGLRLRDTALSASSMEEITEKMLEDYGAQGGTFADAVENYLINACSIAPETLQKIKTLLLEDYTPTADKVYYNVDFMVKGEKYLTQRIADGKKAHELLPNIAVDEISLYWSTSENGEKFDFSKPIKKNTTLYLITEKIKFEEAEELSLADLGIYEDFVPNGQSIYTYKSLTGKESRIFKFNYIPNGAFDLQIGFNGWSNRLWIPGSNEIYVLQEDNRSFHSVVDSFQKGQSYEMEFGMKKVISGTKKGQYLLYLKVDGKLTNTYYSTVADNPFSILFYGTGNSILKNVNIPVTATFKNGNTVYKTIECSKLGLIPSFANPEAPSGSYFAGWFESGKNYAWNFGFDRISKSTTFTSKFTSKLYTVTFDSKGGTFNGSQSVKVGDGFAVKKPVDPVKDGYYFDGWYNGSKKFDFNTVIHSNTVLTAKWTKDVYEDCDIISLNDLGIYGDYTAKDTFIQSYVSTTGKESRIFKFYYTPLNNPQLFVGFNGWDNRIWLTQGNEVVLAQDDTHTLIKPYTFETNKTYAVEYGMKKVIDGKNVGKYYLYLKINDTLIGEYLSSKGKNPHQIMLYGTGTAKISEYPVPVKATFKANGSVHTTQTVNRSNLLKAPSEPKSKDSSKPYFLAWMNGSKEWDFAKNKVYKNITLTAKFVKSLNYVTFDYGCKDYASLKKRVETGKKVVQPEAPTRKGYEFRGWYNGSKKFDFNTAIKSNIVLKANWEKIRYEECDTISLNDLGIYDEKHIVEKDNYYTYTSTTGKESRIFKFKYIPSKGSDVQIGFNGWNNRLWLTNVNDLYLISEDGKAAGTSYPFKMGKEYSIEFGMKKILNGIDKGNYYLYVTINGKLVNEYISNIGSNPQGVLFYSENKPVLKNAFVPVKITYMVAGRVYKIQTVMRSGLSTEPAKPNSIDSSKPDFYGWTKKGSKEPVNFYTDRFYEDTVLTAEFAKNVHEVTFIDDGEVVKFFRIKGDAVIEEFEPVNRFMKDYIWYNGNKPFDFTKKVTKNITLTAKWVDIELEDYDILSLFDLGIEGDYGGYHNSESFTPVYSKSNTTYSKIFRVIANMQDYRNFWVMFDDWGLKRFWMCADNIPNSASYVGLNSEWGYISLMFLDLELNRDYLMEFGLIRVKTGRNAGKDLIFVRIDGKVAAFAYTDELVDYGEAKYIDKKIYLRTEAITFKNVDNFYNVVFKENGKEIMSAKVRRSETLYAWSLLDEKNILPRDPEVPEDKRKAGMIFAGWYDQDKERCDVNFDPIMKDMVLEPQFGYNVTFDTGEKKKTVKVPAGWCVDEIEAPNKDGYRFDKWTLDGKKYDFSKPVNSNIVLKAKYIKTYTVKFMAGDDVYRTYEVDKGSCVKKPKQNPDPFDFELDDTYVFNRWLLNDKQFDFDTKILSNTVLKASFISKSELARIEMLKKLAPYGAAVVFIGLAVTFILIFKRKREKKNG